MDGRTERLRPGRPVVSLIIPAYNDAENLARTLPMLRADLDRCPDVELIVVDDGSRDHTAELVATQLRGWSQAQLISLPWNQGKGSAVKAGVSAARGEQFVFMDADLSADIADLPRLLSALDDADVAIGSRSIAGSRVEYQSSMRQFQSKFFNSVACVLTQVVASDTQCGFKAFRADAGKLLFHLCEGRGFAFDVELLALAQLLDLRVVEVPIHWVDVSGTSVRMVRDPILMVRDILRTRQRCRVLERQLGRGVEESVQPGLGLDAQMNELLQAARRAVAQEREIQAVDLVLEEERAEALEQHTDGRRMAPTALD
jgi:glycosyltransferase involved in cell wall biosynthesis